ncbi:putative multi-domain containing protein [Aduncisulcus paluster]|uniref:Multi-domain containing protein n=1 Tax=Aduncisulcus paluster TaxID=2918883 RepID=A0ABQ5JRW7_9EUKA|nr:putative multi-domain containing protein [Aduncisulcus paluster]
MGFFDWFFDVLSFLGLYEKKGKLVFLGLDNAGKTTLLNMLVNNSTAAIRPTGHALEEEVRIGRIRFKTFDLGGHETVREAWSEYYFDASAVVYLVDLADRERIDESRRELHKLLSSPDLKSKAFLILGNKIDLAGALTPPEAIEALGIGHLMTTRDPKVKLPEGTRPLQFYTCSIIRKEGYGDGFMWMSKYV